MRRRFYFTHSVLICLCLTSCAGIYRTTYYITETQGWKKADYNGVNDIAYTSDTAPDSIMLNVNQSGTIYPQSIRFTDNEGYMMTPTMIESLDIVHEQDITKLDSTAIVQGIKTSGAIRLRWYFKGKQAKKKGFSVLMDAPAVNGKDGKPLLIWFRRKTVYEYVPLFTH